MNYIVVALLCCSLWNSPYEKFTDRFVKQYHQDEWMRPTDTLFYIPKVMNLSRSGLYRKLGVSHKREDLFDCLVKRQLFLVYPHAVSIETQTTYLNPRGEMDYINRIKREVCFYEERPELYCDNALKLRKLVLCYILNYKPDYLFKISELDEVDTRELYWSIKNGLLYAVVLCVKNQTITEYEAEEYVMNIAPDYVLFSSDRLGYYLSPSEEMKGIHMWPEYQSYLNE